MIRAGASKWGYSNRRCIPSWIGIRRCRVIGFCRKLGFNIQELPEAQPVALKKGLTITCGWVADDSWSLVTTPVASYFNANDCVGVEWRKVAAALGRRVDVLEARLL